jgi:hypothetical protein
MIVSLPNKNGYGTIIVSRIYVIAGNHAQANDYIRRKCEERFKNGETNVSMSDYSYVSTPDTFRGLREVHGVFIGTFRDRPDLEEIVHTIRLINRIPYHDRII